MRYRFSLGRGEAAMVLGGATTVGALLFATGVMTGMAFGRGHTAQPAAGAVLVASPDAATAADSATIARAVADSAAAMQGAPSAPAQPAAFAAPADGIGGPAPDDATAMNADGWSVPAGYAAPAGSPTRWTTLPPAGGAQAADPATLAADPGATRYASADAGTATAPRSRLAPPEPPYTPRAAPGEARFRAYDGGSGPYALQVGRFREEEAALKVVDELHARGHDVYVYTTAERGGPLFSVRMDRYGDRETAMRAAERLEQREQLAAVVVPTEQR
ncbi:SPOR domain-containing protein [Longimicrobium sp.]|uniref:SPOR domain-containing protein n=1 Tax=Longimicrobium sp. TaxID=2029185 RepID=UPI002BF57720|nr:SPOR domain-containing protein [Longimicrobium sp.]HSU13833.1 SPOR domain-containing protein [Longimicrobium sp.]